VISLWTRIWVLHENCNLLWLIPFHLPAGLWLFFAKSRPVLLLWYLRFAFVAACAFVCVSFVLPQSFNPAVYPLLLIIAWRCALELVPGRSGLQS
jgi:hypothetical protein